ncbi:MAG: acyl-CoA/acyl-ACP dehydrogenase [Deltaproteobacteria bacterium]|nr:acyl-CoA/acyl-ACP dehydrogenase [Deltaproteobacteria bacterium]MBW2179719.1 acyl-CoA/acyl-ACP dehydrogenase [Deltaproteobacteria bacterium]
MDLGFSSEQDLLRKSVAEFLSKECPYETVKEIEETEEGYSKKMWKKIAELGWMEAYFPEAYGGYGDPLMDLYIIIEEMGKAAFPSPFISTVIQCGFPILEGGSEDQKKDLLSKIAKGKLIMAMAQYEPEASYLESGITFPAAADGENYSLSGTKMFVMDANVADKLIVAAKTADAGVTLFVVDAKDPGITVRKMPVVGMDNCCEVVFKDVKASKSDIIGTAGKGWEILEKVKPRVVLAKCAEMLGGCKASLDMTSAYAKERVQYGKPIGGFQAIQHFMADMLIAYDTSINLFYKMVWMVEEGMDATMDISGLKARLNEAYKFISERGVHIHGGVGTTREYDVGIFYLRAKAAEFAMGDTDYHLEQVAQGMGM